MANPNIVNVTSIYGNTAYVTPSTTSATTSWTYNGTTALTGLTPAANTVNRVTQITVTNTSASAVNASVAISNNATYGSGTAYFLASTISVPANAVLTIIDKEVVNEIYNIAGGFEQSNLDTVKKVIKEYIDKDMTDDNVRLFLDLSYSRVGQDVRYALDDSKLRALGWKPKAIFDKELPKIVEYYKNKFIW